MTPIGRTMAVGPPWMVDLLGRGAMASVSRLAWGFRNETWRVGPADGRDLAITRFGDSEVATRVASLATAIRPRLLAAGISTPAVVDLGFAAATGVLVTEFVDGIPGAELLDSDGGPARVGSILGDTWRRLGAIDPSGLLLEAAWTDPAVLAAASSARLDRLAPWLTGRESESLGDQIATLPDLLADRQPGFVHGDLVPVNIVVRDGALVALLDFESGRIADRLLDAAWFDWIVGFHHPAAEPAAWQAFTEAAELDPHDPSTRALLRLLPLIRILEILDEDGLPAANADHWARMLRACLERPATPRVQ
jgi:aminoglycoside phosphotransferase (APT) family kinase protein